MVEEPKPAETAVLEPCEEVLNGVSRWTDWDINLMVAIAKAESNCHSDRVGDTNLTYTQNGRTYGYSVGALQVRILPGREWCETGDYYLCAHNIWLSQGYRAWSVYSNGRYLKYM